MKRLSIQRSQSVIQSLLSGTSDNLQEIDPALGISTWAGTGSAISKRPQLLSKRNARWARRGNH